MDYPSKTFLLNSGSFLIYFSIICLESTARLLLNSICLGLKRFTFFRKLGVMVSLKKKSLTWWTEGQLRLFTESYFELCMCSLLALVLFFEI